MLFAPILNSSIMLGNYLQRQLQQTTYLDAFFSWRFKGLLFPDLDVKKYIPLKSLRPNKKIPVFRVTGPYLNLMKPRIFSGFSGKKYNFIHFERRNAFQNA